jgi:transcription termination factor NusB
MTKLEKFAEIIIKKLRDENYEFYLSQRNYSQSMTLDEYYQKLINPNYDPDSQKTDDERFEFLNSLTSKQIEQLDKLIISILDSTAFNFLREVEENLMEDKSIGLTIENQNIEQLTKDLLSGTLFGEYFLWCEQTSKFGKYQY